MRIRFTRAGYAVAAGVAATAMLGLSAAPSAGAAPAATTACRFHCVDISFVNPGKNAILGVHSGMAVYNNLVRLLPGSNGAYKEDFSEITVGTVDPLYCDGSVPVSSLFTPRQCLLLKSAHLDKARTFQLAFNGNNGGSKQLCIGTWNNTTPVVNGNLRLVTCGVAADTVLIQTSHLPIGTTSGKKVAKAAVAKPVSHGCPWLINGGSDNFSNPVVATSDGTYPSQPTWSTVDVNGGKAIDTQEVCITKGPFKHS